MGAKKTLLELYIKTTYAVSSSEGKNLMEEGFDIFSLLIITSTPFCCFYIPVSYNITTSYVKFISIRS